MEYYSALKRNEPSSSEMTYRKLKCILLSERSQCEKTTYYMTPTTGHSGNGTTMETVKRSVIVRDWEGKGGIYRWSTEDF